MEPIHQVGLLKGIKLFYDYIRQKGRKEGSEEGKGGEGKEKGEGRGEERKKTLVHYYCQSKLSQSLWKAIGQQHVTKCPMPICCDPEMPHLRVGLQMHISFLSLFSSLF